MGGIYIDCGSFTGSDDKSGKPILFVLEGMKATAHEEARAILTRLRHDVEAWLWTTPPVEFRIASHDAYMLFPCISTYRRQIEGVLPSLDKIELNPVVKKEAADGINFRGPAHQYRCICDLESAFETAISENQPVVLTWD